MVAMKKYRNFSVKGGRLLSNSNIPPADLKKEAEIISKLSNVNLLELLGVSGSAATIDTLIFHYYANGNLYDFIQSEHADATKFFNSKDPLVLKLANSISDGMAYLHEKSVIHCDLKSPNILLTDTFTPKVITCVLMLYG
jgi:serine/threonine protein kinase